MRWLCPTGTLVALAAVAGSARGDAVDKIGKRLNAHQSEVSSLTSGIKRPKQLGQARTADLATRRLIDAQVNFGVGNYDDAAVQLYDFVEKHKRHPSYDEGLYYLSESLFQKGDFVASRSYFEQLVRDVGEKSKFYQQGLERLIELTLKLSDSKDVDEWMAKLDQIPSTKLRASVPYVRGKYHYFREEYDKAVPYLTKVAAGSQYHFQAHYVLGACYIATGKLGNAAKEYEALVRRKPETNDDRRVIELSHMALGRIHYERDQPSKAIDRYLMISRRSDLFDEALYEVAWVYVKNKEFDKALRALELLALANPQSARMPDVKILEGNLRIRKAQKVVDQAQGNAAEEYAVALSTFEMLKETFKQPREELVRLMKEHEDPRVFMAQITGRTSESFDTHSTLPEVAAAWLREEPDVQRVIGIEDDLGQIRDEITEAEETIERLEAALSTPSRVNIFPSLASKRTRGTEILEDIFALRTQLATHQRALFGKYADAGQTAELERLAAERQKIARELADLPNAQVAYGERIQKARDSYDLIDQRAAEVSTVLHATEAQLIALDKYIKDIAKDRKDGKPAAPEGTDASIADQRAELEATRTELEALRRDIVLAKDRAGTGDESAEAARTLRARLQAALDAEHTAMRRLVAKMGGKDQAKAQQIIGLTEKANTIAHSLDKMNATIDDIVESALGEVRSSLTDEKAKLSAYKAEYGNYEVESRELGGEILGVSFDGVAKKFYEVLLRSDVGVVDVAWSLKEAADQATKRLNFDQARERKTLDSEFSDVVDEMMKEQQPEPAPAPPPPPAADEGGAP